MQKKKSMEKQERRRTKDFFDRIAPSTIQSIKPYDIRDITDEILQSLLDLNKLNVDDFAVNFSEIFE